MDERVNDILEKAQQACGLDLDDITYLLSFSETTDEAASIIRVAQALGKSLVDNEGFIHAQIGVDSHACKENCAFCAFANINKPDPASFFEIDTESLRTLAAFFSKQGAHLVSLMATAGLNFETLVDFVEQARSVMNDDTILLVNGPDFTRQQTDRLHRAGAQAAYHALRLGEGTITDIDPAQRLETIDNLRASNLALMTGVEPLWEGARIPEIAERIQLTPTLHPLWIGACNLSSAQGTAMQHAHPVSPQRVNQVGAILRLAAGQHGPIGGVGGVVWVDAGADPRCRGKQDTLTKLETDIAQAKELLNGRGWQVASQQSAMQRCIQAAAEHVAP